MAAQFQARQTFAASGTPDEYAAEEIILAPASADVVPAGLTAVTVLVETLDTATDATVELWLLKVGGDPTEAADYFNSGESLTAGAETWPLASWPGAKIRVKSGDNAGDVVVSATAD